MFSNISVLSFVFQSIQSRLLDENKSLAVERSRLADLLGNVQNPGVHPGTEHIDSKKREWRARQPTSNWSLGAQPRLLVFLCRE